MTYLVESELLTNSDTTPHFTMDSKMRGLCAVAIDMWYKHRILNILRKKVLLYRTRYDNCLRREEDCCSYHNNDTSDNHDAVHKTFVGMTTALTTRTIGLI